MTKKPELTPKMNSLKEEEEVRVNRTKIGLHLNSLCMRIIRHWSF